MKKRIFIAVNMPEEAKKVILDWQDDHRDLPVRWTNPDNFHVTMAFVGNVEENVIERIITLMAAVAEHFKVFDIRLSKIIPGPSAFNPRMIWIEMDYNETLRQLNSWVDNALVANRIPYEDTHNFHPHITIARAKGNDLKGKKINADLRLAFKAESIDIMESRLYATGPEYKALKILKFID